MERLTSGSPKAVPFYPEILWRGGVMLGRRDLLIFLVFAGCFSFVVCVPQTLFAIVGQESSASDKISPSARWVIDQAIKKMGGERFRQIKTLTRSGRFYILTEGGTAGMLPFKSKDAFPDKRRFSYGKNKPIILVNNGKQAWRLDRLGRGRQSQEEIRAWRLRARYGLYHLLTKVVNEPGILMVDAGSDFIDNVTVFVVEIVDVQRVRIKIFVDKNRLLPVRIAYRLQHPRTRIWEDYALTYGNFKMLSGILVPRRETRWRNRQRKAELFYNQIIFNLPIVEKDFNPIR